MTDAQRARWIKVLREFHADLGLYAAPEIWTDQQVIDNTQPIFAAQVWWDIKRTSLEWNTVSL